MSDPVTNVEIEDVLSSIRRLVAEGNKTATAAKAVDVVKTTPVKTAERFVLTPALRVTEDAPVDADVPETDTDSQGDDAGSVKIVEAILAAPAEPLVLEPEAMLHATMVHDHMSPSERASLEATIAELEAAVTFKPDDEWEPDGSETAPTAGFVEVFAALDEEIEDADEVSSQRVVHLRPETSEPTFRHVPIDEAEVDDEDTDYGDDMRATDDDGMPIPDDLDETLAAYIAGGSALDRAEIRQLVVDVVREELRGELGERITRNVRKLVRREILRATQANIYD